MRSERIPGIVVGDDERRVSLRTEQEITLKPGDSATWLFSPRVGELGYVTVHRAGLLRRWGTILRAWLRGARGPRCRSCR